MSLFQSLEWRFNGIKVGDIPFCLKGLNEENSDELHVSAFIILPTSFFLSFFFSFLHHLYTFYILHSEIRMFSDKTDTPI